MSDSRKTFVGSGFGTLVVSNGGAPAPEVVSARRLLRDSLPAAYYPGEALMRFLHGLESVYDPIFALLDGLHAHFSADVAPEQLVELMAAWLSVDLDERQSTEQRRATLRHAAELWRRRGTRAGLELALALALPDLQLRVEDEGGVRLDTGAGQAAGRPAAAAAIRRLLRPAPLAGGEAGRDRLHRRGQARACRLPRPGPRRRCEGDRRVRRCEACGREYADGRDFCDCGQYLRWERTREVQLVGSGAAGTPPPAPPLPPPVNGPSPPSALARGEADGAGEEGLATIVLRTPGAEPGRDGRLSLNVVPGAQPAILHARVRNISEIVDHFNITIHGLPDSWYTVVPPTVYLLPLGHGTECEYEAEIRFHPPPRPEAEARRWDLWVVASSRSRGVIAAIASFALHVEPFELLEPSVHPRERGRRRKAHYEVTLRNQGNVTSLAALGLGGVEERCRHEFARPQLELASGEETKTRLTVRPRRPLIMGKVREHRFDVVARTGEDGEKLLAGHPVTATEVARAAEAQGAAKPSLWRRLGRILQIPGVMAPGLQVGQQGVQLRKPMLGAGGVQGQQLRLPARLDPAQAGRLGVQPGPATETVLLPPSRGLFRQKPWLPWWLLILLLCDRGGDPALPAAAAPRPRARRAR